MNTPRRGQLAGLTAAVLFGCSAPLISTLTSSGSALSIAGLLYAGATLALLVVRLVRGTQAETPLSRQDWPALGALPQGCLKVNSDAVFGELNASQREHSFDVVGQRAQSTAN